MEPQNTDTNEMKNKSFRLSEEVTRRIGELVRERQVTTNQLFEEFVTLSENRSHDPLLTEEDEQLSLLLRQVGNLFEERSLRLKRQATDLAGVKTRHEETVSRLEAEVIEERARIEEEGRLALERLAKQERGLVLAAEKAEAGRTKAEETLARLEKEHAEAIKASRKEIFSLEERLRRGDEEKERLQHQLHSLTAVTDDYKARARNVERLEEENRELSMRVRLLEHEKERQEAALAEQIELAILRDRGRRPDETRDER
ncbi:hypothetical protein ADM98_00620 [Exiguobacterium sp. BMC-KP]|uniref:hypothetical protein n=1 Tax=Exiguobacterium sp. BMC-KP TaxID=1684312 RepID=UPI0006AA2C79|nr:hypothetical protein [Exiguobacterium sp. BMC-KP]KOP31389.1 hypothetical protein ADM98_00620 [Exiguobacterium sp. BMC-KP]